eukprot:TRINITY_DN10383_c0_g3_i1.p1 TRINITY_DN10383_c0_g3~~TRINITY_DN10383_c0_g3_i1.p1  ORF type:complete len:251 (+),score=62.35 TRINITY_DN10383_c0_g3_i1:213-965(+)
MQAAKSRVVGLRLVRGRVKGEGELECKCRLLNRGRNVVYIAKRESGREDVKDNWEQLKDYLRESVSRTDELMQRQNKRSNSTKRSEFFPYHSYLKNKRELPMFNPYIISTEAKLRNTKYKITIPAVKPLLELKSKEIACKDDKAVKSMSVECRTTTARVLREKYKSLYEKLEARETPTRLSKNSLSPFHSYIKEQCKMKTQALKCMKKDVRKVSVRETVHKKHEDESKLYIGEENFPLSAYERSMIARTH